MKKRLFTIALAGTLFSLTGCYTTVCPTYAVKPAKVKEVKAEKPESIKTDVERPS